MRDKRMKALGLFIALSLAVCLVASGIVSNAGSSYATTISLKWTRVTIPVTDEMQLYPGSDVGPMAVSPDGETVFAAVQNESSGNWSLFKSTDGAFSWQDTDLRRAMAAIADTSNIMVVELSPAWNDDGLIFVATENRVYSSEDRGRTFGNVAAVPGTTYAGGTYVITSLGSGLDADGRRVVVAVGTKDPTAAVGGDVYILNLGAWVAQGVGAYDVLAVGLSPNYATDQAVIAVVTDVTRTMVRTKRMSEVWAGAVNDATFKDDDGFDFASYRASLEIPSDYIATSSSPGYISVYVGLSATGPRGDVFFIFWQGWPATPTINDCDVRGEAGAGDPSETNVWSIAITGQQLLTTIVVGTEEVNPTLPPTINIPGQLLVYTGSPATGGGGVWEWYPAFWGIGYDESGKQPTGEAKATVVMTDSVAYLGCFGNQSAVSAALSAQGSGGVPFYSWNQRGLIDTSIDEITDMSPSEAYSADGTMFITTRNASVGDTSLWRTETEGGTWERVYCSTLTGNSTTRVLFDMVRQTADGVVLAQNGGKSIIPSSNNSELFLHVRGMNLAENISAFVVESASTYYAGGAGGSVQRTADQGVTWTSSTGSEIPSTDTVVDLVLTDGGDIYAGTDQGGVYKDTGGNLEFEQVGPSKPGASGDIVHVASNPCEDNFVYAGINGSAGGIWRFDLGDDESAEWEQIAGAEVGDISSIACSDCIGMDGILYAVGSTGTGWRSINPATTKGAPEFEEIKEGLNISAGDSVRRGLKLVSDPNMLFAVGGNAPCTQIWTASDETVKMKLLAPEDGSISGTILEDEAFLGRAMVMLEWKDILRAESYEVQIGFDEELDSPVDISYYDSGTRYSNGTVKVVYPWLGTKYYWRVRVGKAGPGGITVGAPYSSQWSETWSFITPLGPAPSIPGLLSPQPGQENVILRPVLQWNSSVAATGYELILAAGCDWNNPVLNFSGENAISDTAYQLTTITLAKNTSYCWQVRGVNDITHSPWSDTGTFTTGVTVGPGNSELPVWVWVIIALGTVFILSILVLITQSRRY